MFSASVSIIRVLSYAVFLENLCILLTIDYEKLSKCVCASKCRVE